MQAVWYPPCSLSHEPWVCPVLPPPPLPTKPRGFPSASNTMHSLLDSTSRPNSEWVMAQFLFGSRTKTGAAAATCPIWYFEFRMRLLITPNPSQC